MKCFFDYKALVIFSLMAVLLGCSEAEPKKEMLKQAVAI